VTEPQGGSRARADSANRGPATTADCPEPAGGSHSRAPGLPRPGTGPFRARASDTVTARGGDLTAADHHHTDRQLARGPPGGAARARGDKLGNLIIISGPFLQQCRSVCLVITKEVNQEETQMPDTHKGIHINELTSRTMPLQAKSHSDSVSSQSAG
jgi:hypothetical protein